MLDNAGFLSALQVCRININRSLISALVERWRPQTHTFHFPCGESTVTLEDVLVLLGLPIEGWPVIASTNGNSVELRQVCYTFLGGCPSSIKGGAISLTWLDAYLRKPDLHIEVYLRGYILSLIGNCILPDKTEATVHGKYLTMLIDLTQIGQFSWGSACLAMLYRNLCRATVNTVDNIGGCLVLLQTWAWYRLPYLAPIPLDPISFPLVARWRKPNYRQNKGITKLKKLRRMLDHMQDHQFFWQPYNHPQVQAVIPWRNSGPHTRPYVVPLICFETLEWHPSDRVMRQYGLVQTIPELSPTLEVYHNKDLRGHPDLTNWYQLHEPWVQMWMNRQIHVVQGAPLTDYQPTQEYWSWYVSNYPFRTLSHMDEQGSSGSSPSPPPCHEHPQVLSQLIYTQHMQSLDLWATRSARDHSPSTQSSNRESISTGYTETYGQSFATTSGGTRCHEGGQGQAEEAGETGSGAGAAYILALNQDGVRRDRGAESRYSLRPNPQAPAQYRSSPMTRQQKGKGKLYKGG